MKVFKKWFTKQSKVVLTPENTSTRLFSLYGETNSLEQIKSKIREIENTLNNLPEIPQLPDLRNYAVKNADNNFTTSQTIQGHLNSNGLYKVGARQNIVQIKNQGAKEASIVFEQNNAGFRNYSYFNIMHKYSNTNEVKLFSLYTKNTNEGIFMLCENNKLTFENDTTIDNIATPTTDKQAATKKYVDDKVASIPTPPQVDLSNVVKTNESANLAAQLYFFGNDNGVVGFAGRAQYSNASYVPSEGNEFAPKSYVDSRTSTIPVGKRTWGSTVTVTKTDFANGIFKYTASVGISGWGNGTYCVLVQRDLAITSNANSQQANIRNSFTQTDALIVVVNNNTPQIEIELLSTRDLKPGSTGTFQGIVNGTYYIFKLNDSTIRPSKDTEDVI